MTNYEIFELLYAAFRDKFDDENVVFTQKYVVGKQQIRIHFLNDEKKLMLSNVLIFLTNCKKNLPMFLIEFCFISTVLMLKTTLLFLVFNLDIIISDYCNDFAKIIICDSSNAPNFNTQLVEWECDAQTHCATEPQIPSSLLPYVF